MNVACEVETLQNGLDFMHRIYAPLKLMDAPC